MTLDTSQSSFTPGVKNQGWWSSSQTAQDDNANYVVAESYRSFFTFDISLVAGEVEEASLFLTRFSVSGEDAENVGFFDVSTEAATLNNNIGINLGIFDDLGTGSSYGVLTVAGPGLGQREDVLELQLSAAAIADINASRGGFFSIGAKILTDEGDGDFVFGGSTFGGVPPGGVQRLALGGNDVRLLPEPSSIQLLLCGLTLSGVGGVLRRYKGKSRSRSGHSPGM
ncbi:hypothetical protein [Maioricimonas sp. JC845]|uniref:hypothetical protein n=1 Tax=Maioricimonas sp. JC845 TaxID=3232138 RepID=UPI0034590F89